MRLLLSIFALLALGHESYSKCDSEFVTYSPANPVEMWPSDCETYNEKEVCGIFPKCYNQPFNCDDTIPFQITDDLGDDFALVIENEDGDEIDRIEFSQYVDAGGNIFPELDEFVNESIGTSWTLGAIPSVTINVGQSKSLVHVIPEQAAGVYDVSYQVDKPAGEIAFALLFLNDAEEVLGTISLQNGSNTDSVTITGKFTRIHFRVLDLESGSDTFRVYSASMILKTFSYYTSFVPSDLSICDRHIRTKIVNVTASPEVEEMKSDYLDIQEDHQCTNQIEYTNNKNVLGLIFEQVSPVPTFYLRVHSVFFHERFPTEQFSMELTSGYERLSGSIKAQRLFETDYLPYYMHRKLQLIFMMQSILIDGFYWTQEEAYQEIESSNKRWPVKMANVYLTQRDFVQRVTT
jgi:hypothetical protein